MEKLQHFQHPKSFPVALRQLFVISWMMKPNLTNLSTNFCYLKYKINNTEKVVIFLGNFIKNNTSFSPFQLFLLVKVFNKKKVIQLIL